VASLTGSRTDAGDITQDIFSILWQYREKVDPEKNIRSLLFLIARRTVSNNHRARQIRQKYAETAWFEQSDNFTSHDAVVEKEAELQKRALLSRMPEQQRRIFEMCHDEGLTPDEIAQRLGIKRETVYSKLSIARKEIKDAILLSLILFSPGLSNDSIREIINSILK
jgi:RNA polymerase sigma factor, sigma-70 family